MKPNYLKTFFREPLCKAKYRLEMFLVKLFYCFWAMHEKEPIYGTSVYSKVLLKNFECLSQRLEKETKTGRETVLGSQNFYQFELCFQLFSANLVSCKDIEIQLLEPHFRVWNSDALILFGRSGSNNNFQFHFLFVANAKIKLVRWFDLYSCFWKKGLAH